MLPTGLYRAVRLSTAGERIEKVPPEVRAEQSGMPELAAPPEPDVLLQPGAQQQQAEPLRRHGSRQSGGLPVHGGRLAGAWRSLLRGGRPQCPPSVPETQALAAPVLPEPLVRQAEVPALRE